MKNKTYVSDWRLRPEQLKALANVLEGYPGGVPRSEYPRPQFVRPEWRCLNGRWEYFADPHNIGLEHNWQNKRLPFAIIVPFAPQTELSGIGSRYVDEVVWYAREFQVPEAWMHGDQRVLLHFGACDYESTVWVNGKEVGWNQGGHVPFQFDVTFYLRNGHNRVVVRVEDQRDAFQPRGKQSVNGESSGCIYHATTGIWQTVWMECVPALRIESVSFTSHLDEDPGLDTLDVEVQLHAPALDWQVRVEILENDDVEAAIIASGQEAAVNAHMTMRLPMRYSRRWSPLDPHLYGVRLTLLREGQTYDEVHSYFGLREVEVKGDAFLLNQEPVYLRMVLDQGYWPESGMTAPTDEALRADVEWCRRFGFNGVRKHQKVEDPRWLYWCDKLGLMVWGEMANARMWRLRTEERFLREWERAVRRDLNHPSLVTWVPLNESWGVPDLSGNHPGQYAFVERIVALTRRLDPSRPVIDNDGWEHSDVTDIVAMHDYTTGDTLRRRYHNVALTGQLPAKTWGGKWAKENFACGARHHGQPVMLTEVGGFLSIPEAEDGALDAIYGLYNTCRTPTELLHKYRDLMQVLSEFPFLSGFCYTQLTDIEQEKNGLLTFDRKPKVDPLAVAAVHEELLPDHFQIMRRNEGSETS